jgi:hypothetical protein
MEAPRCPARSDATKWNAHRDGAAGVAVTNYGDRYCEGTGGHEGGVVPARRRGERLLGPAIENSACRRMNSLPASLSEAMPRERRRLIAGANDQVCHSYIIVRNMMTMLIFANAARDYIF